jgi:hypothetical protein
MWGALSDERTGPSPADLFTIIETGPTGRVMSPFSYPPGTEQSSYDPGN